MTYRRHVRAATRPAPQGRSNSFVSTNAGQTCLLSKSGKYFILDFPWGANRMVDFLLLLLKSCVYALV